MFGTTNLVCITRQRSASQFSGATHMPWLSHGGTRPHIGPSLFFISYFIFHAKEGQTKSGKEWGTTLRSKRSPAQSLGSICLIKRKVSGAIHTTNSLSPSSFLSFHFLSVVAWHIPVTNSLLLYWKREIGLAVFTCLKIQALQVSARVEDSFGPTSWSFI